MYTDADLDAAVAEGALSADSVARFRAFIDGRHHASAVDEEQFRLLTGFNDIFVSIAIVLLLAAIGWLGRGTPGALGVAVASWGLAEFFTRRRRMALPSILLLLSFVGGVFFAAISVLLPEFLDQHGRTQDAATDLLIAVAWALAAGGAYLHWRRFKVPITVAAGTLALVGTLLVLLIGPGGWLHEFWQLPALACGLAVFGFAMSWDMSDPLRRTRRADVAFWLHLAAAPLIVHPAFALLGILDPARADLARAVTAIAIYLVLGVVALAIDRRALLVSALIYVVYAMSALFKAAGTVEASFALTGLVIGAALLFLSAFWHGARSMTLGLLPAALSARLPGLRAAA